MTKVPGPRVYGKVREYFCYILFEEQYATYCTFEEIL